VPGTSSATLEVSGASAIRATTLANGNDALSRMGEVPDADPRERGRRHAPVRIASAACAAFDDRARFDPMPDTSGTGSRRRRTSGRQRAIRDHATLRP
jgi:hypothetical protein